MWGSHEMLSARARGPNHTRIPATSQLIQMPQIGTLCMADAYDTALGELHVKRIHQSILHAFFRAQFQSICARKARIVECTPSG